MRKQGPHPSTGSQATVATVCGGREQIRSSVPCPAWQMRRRTPPPTMTRSHLVLLTRPQALLSLEAHAERQLGSARRLCALLGRLRLLGLRLRCAGRQVRAALLQHPAPLPAWATLGRPKLSVLLTRGCTCAHCTTQHTTGQRNECFRAQHGHERPTATKSGPRVHSRFGTSEGRPAVLCCTQGSCWPCSGPVPNRSPKASHRARHHCHVGTANASLSNHDRDGQASTRRIMKRALPRQPGERRRTPFLHTRPGHQRLATGVIPNHRSPPVRSPAAQTKASPANRSRHLCCRPPLRSVPALRIRARSQNASGSAPRPTARSRALPTKPNQKDVKRESPVV